MKAIIFDLDNTIYDENDYIKNILNHFCTENKIEPINLDEFLSDEFRLSSNDIFGDFLKQIDFYSTERQEKLFKHYKSINCKLFPYQDFTDLAQHLIKKKIKLSIITNGVIEAQKNKIRCLNIYNYFSDIIYAREEGKNLEKPKTNSFKKALNLLKLNPDDVFYVGDNPHTDIKGANDSGIKSLRIMRGYCRHIKNNDEYKRINDFYELKELICQEN